jgi:glycerophosphoryl diester phosphodiesterase
MFPSLTSPVIFAHRGASSHAPENTLAAFQLAIDHGAKAIELDVQLTKDQEVVVFHDSHLNRTTDGTGKIKDYTLSELKNFSAGISFCPAFQNVKIPSLAEVLDVLPPDILINIELKNNQSPLDGLPSRTAGLVREFRAQNRVLISSFNFIALSRFKKELPSVPCGRLLDSKLMVNFFSSFPGLLAKFQSVHLSYKSLNPRVIASFKRAGKKVFTYTLNHTQDILTAVNMGIDGFFTDDPGFARRILSQNGLLIK